MILSILGSLFTILAVALPEILKWMERNGKIRSAADQALTAVSLDGMRRLALRVRALQGPHGPPPVP